MIELTHEPIDPSRAIALVSSPRAGAIVLFLGVTRAVTGERETASLDYECYPEMARGKLAELEAAARRRWPIIECAIIHRLGHLEIEEPSVAVAVSSPHRGDAFDCGRWLIDTLKLEVPIWKQENWSDGTHEWVHPGVESKLSQQQQQQQQSSFLNPEP
jgi:molybdopterin synthase catalytic subunit